MELGAAGLSEQPFPSHGKPLAIASYASKISAIEALNDTKVHPTGLALLQGPPLSGKTTLIRSFVKSLPEDFSVAVIDGKGLNTTRLLATVLEQFGYDLEVCSAKELLALVRVFALHQAASHESPILIVENAHELNPSGFRTLCELAELRIRERSAIKLVLVSDCSMEPIMSAQAMEPVARRVVHNFHLHPMNESETQKYLHRKLDAAGSEKPERIFPGKTSRAIWEASAGWPGIVDRIALLALAQSDSLPISESDIERPDLPTGTWADRGAPGIAPDEIVPPAPPQLIISNNGSIMDDLTMDKPRAMIGRSVHNDISISSRFISRHHALLVRHGSSTFLMDLNSTNGTFVNSKRVSNQLLVHNDIIRVGHHNIKFHDPCATGSDGNTGIDFSDTQIIKTLDDMRSLFAQKNMSAPVRATENLPTIQN